MLKTSQPAHLVVVLVINLSRSQVKFEQIETFGGFVSGGKMESCLPLIILLFPVGSLAEEQLEALVVTLKSVQKQTFAASQKLQNTPIVMFSSKCNNS